jgi:hypothetical protein
LRQKLASRARIAITIAVIEEVLDREATAQRATGRLGLGDDCVDALALACDYLIATVERTEKHRRPRLQREPIL